MRVSRWVGVAALCCFLAVGCKGDPNSPDYWAKAFRRAEGKREKERLSAELRELPTLNPAFLPLIHQELAAEGTPPKARSDLARILGKLKDPSSVAPLAQALDLSGGDSAVNEMNRSLVIALGEVGDRSAIPHLLKLMNARDAYTRIEAISALGALHATEAVDGLLTLVTTPTEEPFVVKKSIQALGDTQDPRSIPTLIRMMFVERKGISFYPEASFALFQVGPAAAPPLRAVLQGQDASLLTWAKENKVIEPALFAKSAQVLGDLQDKASVPLLLSKLRFENELLDVKLFVRMRVADALGRLRASEAVQPLTAMLSEVEPTARQEYVRALTLIGGREPIPALTQSGIKGDALAREIAAQGLGQLGDEREIPTLEKWAKEEPQRTADACKKEPDLEGCSDVAKLSGARLDLLRKELKALEAGRDCKTDSACWTKRLDDPEPLVRQRAALELSRKGASTTLPALVSRSGDPQVDARLAAVQGSLWILTDAASDPSKAGAGAGASAAIKEKLPILQEQLEKERQSGEFVKVNEELKRLTFRLASL